jgi:hypothetical protein
MEMLNVASGGVSSFPENPDPLTSCGKSGMKISKYSRLHKMR